jgi:hypothetical protein
LRRPVVIYVAGKAAIVLVIAALWLNSNPKIPLSDQRGESVDDFSLSIGTNSGR